MSEIIHAALDAMGGDNAPKEIIKGAVKAVKANPGLKVTLTGPEQVLREELKKYQYPEDRIAVCDAPEIIEMGEPPVEAIRTKRNSSMVKGLQLVKSGECDAFVTAGSTGAALAGGQLLVGRIRGIERPPLAPLIPSAKGPVLLIDCGANMDPRPPCSVSLPRWGLYICAA